MKDVVQASILASPVGLPTNQINQDVRINVLHMCVQKISFSYRLPYQVSSIYYIQNRMRREKSFISYDRYVIYIWCQGLRLPRAIRRRDHSYYPYLAILDTLICELPLV